jgi:hypothetical protein
MAACMQGVQACCASSRARVASEGQQTRCALHVAWQATHTYADTVHRPAHSLHTLPPVATAPTHTRATPPHAHPGCMHPGCMHPGWPHLCVHQHVAHKHQQAHVELRLEQKHAAAKQGPAQAHDHEQR